MDSGDDSTTNINNYSDETTSESAQTEATVQTEVKTQTEATIQPETTAQQETASQEPVSSAEVSEITETTAQAEATEELKTEEMSEASASTGAMAPSGAPTSQKTSFFQRFKSLFKKDNPHYKRNRCVMATCPVTVAGLILLAVFLNLGFLFGNGKIAILNVTPTKIENGILDSKSHFMVDTEHGSVEKLRNAIYLEPAIDYDIKEVTPGSSYEIIPTSDLSDNTVFNIDSVSNEVIAYKWAYQTKKDLSVSKIYPANGANYVSENTVIEFSFSYPDVEHVEQHFTITPEVSGKLEKGDRFWHFTPDGPLAADTTFEITISAGLTYGEEIMSKDFHSTFSTFKREAVVASSEVSNTGITLDGVSYFTEKDTPIVVFEGNDREYYKNSEYITIEQISNVDDFIKHLQGEQVSAESIGDYDFEKKEYSEYSEKYAILNQTLPTGYYVFHFKSSNGQDLYTANIEVNNLDAYAIETERDVVVWVAENGELKSGIKINYQGKDYETGADGLLKIENISDYSNKLEYMKIGNSAQPLAISLKDFKNDLYPRGFIYTDRLLYNPNDTIKVWGYVPLAFFKDAPKRDNFSVIFGELKQYVTIDDEGFFSCGIKLDNHKDEIGDIRLNYNNQDIASRWISIENYSLENYTYEFISDKNFVNAGENIDFKVHVSHVTGFPAINKDLVITYEQKDYYATTNGEGDAVFSLPTEYSNATWDRPTGRYTEYISVKSGGAEYNKYSTDVYFYVFKNSLALEGKKITDSDSLRFTAKNIDLSNPVKTDYNLKNLKTSNYTGPATIRLTEKRYSRYIAHYSYNEYTKENVPVYYTDVSSTVIGDYPAEFVDGQLTFNYPIEYKDPDENTYYSYEAAVTAVDSIGRPAFSYQVTYYSNYYLGESRNSYNNAIYAWQSYNPTKTQLYPLYRFGLKDTIGESPYSLNDTMRLGLYDYSGASIENVGKVLAVAYKESVITDKIFTDNTFDISFDHSIYPGTEVAGAYFVNGRFNRVAPSYFDYDEQDSELTISIETDKTNYEPGETVKAKLIVTHPDGSRANGRVNLSVVNEAIFNAIEDDTSILSSIYANKLFKSYSMSTYRDYDLLLNGGLGAARGGRSNFGDSIFFGNKELINGEAEFEFKLNDSITAFRLTALAVENGSVINAGSGAIKISSYLPLSISTVMPKRVKNTDDLVLNASSITAQGDMVNYAFTINELDKVLTASAAPGQSVSVNFGKIDLGVYNVTISAEDSAGNKDEMVYPLEIIETAQEITVKNTSQINENFEITPAKNPVVMEFYSGDTKHYVKYLDFLAQNQTERLDTLVGYYKSLDFRDKYYHEEASVPVPSFESYMTENGTLKPLLNAEGDYILTALTNYYMPNYVKLDIANYGINPDDDNTTAIEKLLVLASFKDAVLLDLKAAQALGDNLSNDDLAILGIAFAFLGDYDSAKTLYGQIDAANAAPDLVAVLSSFIDKGHTSENIDRLIETHPSAGYLPFAIISFFENNEVDLDETDTVKATVNSQTTEISIHPLEIIREAYYSNNLETLLFSTRSEDVFADYYYQGIATDLGGDYTTDIAADLDNLNVGQNAVLTIDVSALAGQSGSLNIALPSSLKFSATFSGQEGAYLTRNNNEYIKLSLTEKHNNIVTVPLYVVTSGNYNFEPIIFEDGDGNYHLSNNIVFDIQ